MFFFTSTNPWSSFAKQLTSLSNQTWLRFLHFAHQFHFKSGTHLRTEHGKCDISVASGVFWNVKIERNVSKQVSGVHGTLHGQLFALSVLDSDPGERRRIKTLMHQSSKPSNVPELCAHQINNGRLDHHVESLECEQAKAKLAALPPPFNTIVNIPNWEKFHELLQKAYKQHEKFYTCIMRDLVRPMKKPIDKFLARNQDTPSFDRKGPFDSCAVVGNSATLLNRSYGQFIDTHDMVIRSNFARTRTFEKFVGQKTTLAVISEDILHDCVDRGQTCACQPYTIPVPTVVSILVPEHYMDAAVCEYSPLYPTLVTHVQFNRLCKRVAKWYAVKKFMATTGLAANKWDRRKSIGYSTGLQAVVLALSMCKRVDLFGVQDTALSQEFKTYFPNTWSLKKKTWIVMPRRLINLNGEFLFYQDLARTSKASIPQFLAHSGLTLPPVHLYTWQTRKLSMLLNCEYSPLWYSPLQHSINDLGQFGGSCSVYPNCSLDCHLADALVAHKSFWFMYQCSFQIWKDRLWQLLNKLSNAWMKSLDLYILGRSCL